MKVEINWDDFENDPIMAEEATGGLQQDNEDDDLRIFCSECGTDMTELSPEQNLEHAHHMQSKIQQIYNEIIEKPFEASPVVEEQSQPIKKARQKKIVDNVIVEPAPIVSGAGSPFVTLSFTVPIDIALSILTFARKLNG